MKLDIPIIMGQKRNPVEQGHQSVALVPLVNH